MLTSYYRFKANLTKNAFKYFLFHFLCKSRNERFLYNVQIKRENGWPPKLYICPLEIHARVVMLTPQLPSIISSAGCPHSISCYDYWKEKVVCEGKAWIQLGVNYCGSWVRVGGGSHTRRKGKRLSGEGHRLIGWGREVGGTAWPLKREFGGSDTQFGGGGSTIFPS